jgi:hypothetical protein
VGFGVGVAERGDFGGCERRAEAGAAAEPLVVDRQLLADLREVVVGVVDALDVEVDVGAGEARGGWGAVLDLLDGSADELPAAGRERGEPAVQAGEAGRGSGDRLGFCFGEQAGQGERGGALRGVADGGGGDRGGVGWQAPGDERPGGLGGGDLGARGGLLACERARDGDQVGALEPLLLGRGSSCAAAAAEGEGEGCGERQQRGATRGRPG